MAADDGRLRAQVNRLKTNHTQTNFCIEQVSLIVR